jgi:tetratricopeptide (TPR) repeat protein
MIFTATVWLYWPCVHGEFLRGDDKVNLQQAVRWNGLTWAGVQWAFTNTQPYYQALPRLSHILDYQIWGENAAGHHATSVVLHALNAALVFGLLWTLLPAASLSTGERLAMALGVAVAFAIHPLQVEVVAWMSSRTQLLCGTFAIGTLWAYTAGTRRWVVWLLFAGALLSQPMAVSLPFVMLAIDYFVLRQHHDPVAWGRLLREKSAFIVLAVMVGLATMHFATGVGGVMTPLGAVPLSQHVLLMFQSLAFYTRKVVWPGRFSPHYPLNLGLSLGQGTVLASVVCVGMITVLVVWYRRRLPALAAAWGAYLALLLPVSGLMQTGSETMAPRYAYLAVLPLLLVVGGAAVWLWRCCANVLRVVVACLLVGELCIFEAGTQGLMPVWRNDEILWRTVQEQLPDWELANWLLARALLDQGRSREALECAQRYVEITPQRRESHNTLGLVFDQLGKLSNAAGQYEEALRISPDYAEAHLHLGDVFLREGKVSEAIGQYEQVPRNSPDYPEGQFDLSMALVSAGRVQEAIAHYEQALRISPDYAEAHNGLGTALYQTGGREEAVEHYEQALRIKPDFAEAHNNLGNVFLQEGKVSEAIGHYEQALRIKPNYVETHFNLGLALEKMGRTAEAIAHYQQALKLQPDFVPAKSALARLQAGQ